MKTKNLLTAAACVVLALSACAEDKPAPAPAVPPQMPAFNPAMQLPQGPGAGTNVSYEALMRIMQARSELDVLNKKIEERKAEIIESNEEVKRLREEMREKQKKIDEIMVEDEKLKELKAELDTFFKTPMLPTQPPPEKAEKPKKTE